ncbi:MAG: beta-galactosidase [Clostridia bacterium]|nr:beta-galactosidase [Clostridia bacterium]
MNIPRAEHPFPQMIRSNWLNLNGQWEFEIDNGVSGKHREFFKRDILSDKITVPFCPESDLSGIGNKDFMYCVWYRREFELPESFAGNRVILHFGAVDYIATVYINGVEAGSHKGGYTSFAVDITDYIKDGTNVIHVCAEDDAQKYNQPRGKQSDNYHSYRCLYTRTTGIWQTVWLEAVGNTYIKNFYTYADIQNSSVMFRIKLGGGNYTGKTITADVSFDGKPVGKASTVAYGENAYLTVALSELHLWDAGCGNLYDVTFGVCDGEKALDSVNCYFGMRTTAFTEKGFELNGRVVFGRWVLDQGFYPDGIYTAPTDEALKNDIIYSMELGFNGARLHEKVFEPRFLYWADKLGYMVWEEYANWGCNITRAESVNNILPEWLEAVDRDFSHPSIIGWCPLNETWDTDEIRQDNSVVANVYHATKNADSTRPVIDTSGNFHAVKFEIFDVHDYEQNPEKLQEYYSKLKDGIIIDQTERNPKNAGRQPYSGEPVFLSEYGGIRWDVGDSTGWGYGQAPATEEEFLDRYKKLTEVAMQNDKICAVCYTQLYDVEQERNGLMTYDRKYKFNPKYFFNINTQKAAVEEE